MISSLAAWCARAALALLPAWVTLEVYYCCVMCGRHCGSALRAKDHGRVGAPVPLCSSCYNDGDRLLHAMRFARATWRR